MGVTLSTPTYDYKDHNTWPHLLPLYFVSQILNLSPWTLRKWDKKGKLSAVRFGDRQDRKYKKEDILRIINEGVRRTKDTSSPQIAEEKL